MSSDTFARERQHDSSTIQEKIRRRAYELYVQRGSQSGSEFDDRVRAEAEILQAVDASPWSESGRTCGTWLTTGGHQAGRGERGASVATRGVDTTTQVSKSRIAWRGRGHRRGPRPDTLGGREHPQRAVVFLSFWCGLSQGVESRRLDGFAWLFRRTHSIP
jgi:hypothetical protein